MPLHDSASGKTAKMAELVSAGAAGIPGTEVRMRRIEEASAGDEKRTGKRRGASHGS